MENTLSKQEMDKRALALEECERIIAQAFKKGLEATKSLSRAIGRIETEELYVVQFEQWEDYVKANLHMEMRDIRRIHAVASTIQQLERQGLELPSNETQVVELTRLAPERRPEVWKTILELSEQNETPITTEVIRFVIDKEEKGAKKAAKAKPAKVPAPKGVDAPLNFGVQAPAQETKEETKTAPKPAVPANRISLTVKGENALSRIRTICGDSVANALESGSLPMSERDIIRWGEEEDTQLMKNLVYYLAHLRWTLSKALAYETKLIDGETTVDELACLARARSGRFSTRHEGVRITAEIEGQAISKQ